MESHVEEVTEGGRQTANGRIFNGRPGLPHVLPVVSELLYVPIGDVGQVVIPKVENEGL